MSSGSSKGAFKICLGDQIHKVLTLPKDLNAFKELITYFFGLQLPAQWKLQYLDVDDDVITVANDFDYKALSEERSARINIVPIDQSLVVAPKEIERAPERIEQEEESEFYPDSVVLEHSESNFTVTDFGYSQDSQPQKKAVYQTLSQMKDKQRRRALRVVDNLKRSDISEAKKEKLGTLLEEIKDNIAVIKQKQVEAEAKAKAEEQENVLIFEKSSPAVVAQVELSENQPKVSFSASKKQLANRNRANIKRDLKVSYKNYQAFEEVDDENDDDGYDYEPVRQTKLNSVSIEEKARKIKEIFTNIDLEILSFFLKENPHLGVEELVQNYITA